MEVGTAGAWDGAAWGWDGVACSLFAPTSRRSAGATAVTGAIGSDVWEMMLNERPSEKIAVPL